MSYESQQSLRLLESGEASTLAEIRAGRPLVLDFWHTRCGNCPEALTKLDALAASGKLPGVAFAACALSLGEGSFEQTAELVDDEWEHLTHLFMSTDEKEVAKAEFGFSAVPFCVAFAADGAVLYKGSPKAADWVAIFSSAAADAASPASPDSVVASLESAASSPGGKAKPPAAAAPALPPIGSLTLDEDF
jgi:thiol-disulfide isomerase/thioredoxin